MFFKGKLYLFHVKKFVEKGRIMVLTIYSLPYAVEYIIKFAEGLAYED